MIGRIADHMIEWARENWAIDAVWGVLNIDRKLLSAILMIMTALYSMNKLLEWPL